MGNKLLQIIRQAYHSLVSDDSSAYPKTQVVSNGKATDIVRLSTYGICANPPKDAHVLMLSSQGQESSKFGVFNDFLNRMKGLAEGEVVLFNTLTGAFVYMKANGDIEVNTDTKIKVNAGGDIDVDAGGKITADAVGNIDATAGGDINATAQGSINATAIATANITAPTITLNGTVIVNGLITGPASAPLNAANDIQVGALQFGTHIHGGVTTGAGNTGGPQ
jgi:phage gp45-like